MMSRAQVALLQLSLLGMTLTGLVFAWMKYFMKSDDRSRSSTIRGSRT